MEYSTQIRKEYLFLKECGIQPSYVKPTGAYNILTYKYRKTPELFLKAAEFYRQRENEKERERALSAGEKAVDKTGDDTL